MSQVKVCSYCYLIQRFDRVEHMAFPPEDRRRYIEHLRAQHGVVLDTEITA